MKSSCCTPLFGSYGYYSGLPLVVQMGSPFPLPSAPGYHRFEGLLKRHAFFTFEGKLWAETLGRGGWQGHVS